MARRRRSRLAGSPAEHTSEAGKNAAIAVERYARTYTAANAGRCEQAIMSMLEAEFANGASFADERWASKKVNHAMIERAAEGALSAFLDSCSVGTKSRSVSGMRRRRSR
jgi:hypothetical protein